MNFERVGRVIFEINGFRSICSHERMIRMSRLCLQDHIVAVNKLATACEAHNVRNLVTVFTDNFIGIIFVKCADAHA